jgi:hypothetical protein
MFVTSASDAHKNHEPTVNIGVGDEILSGCDAGANRRVGKESERKVKRPQYFAGRTVSESVATLPRLVGRRKTREGRRKRRKPHNHGPEQSVEWSSTL